MCTVLQRFYRRLGIAVALVKKMEAWCREQGAVYAYIATEKDNEASVNLFTKRLDYHKFRTPTILVQPIYAKPKRLNPRVKIVEVKQHSESLYREVFGHVEFFPKDVDAIMRSKLHKGTWMATWRDEEDVTKCEEDEKTEPITSTKMHFELLWSYGRNIILLMIQ